MRNPITSLFNRFSRLSRERKNQIFDRYFHMTGEESVLDIGGQVGERVKMLIDLHPCKSNITVVNLAAAHLRQIKEIYPEINVHVADARRLPFPDKHFDIVYSNAVIEHVGAYADQEAMANEVMRVGKRWYVTTPNRWYPFEFHTRMPVVHWFPRRWMTKLVRMCAYSHVKQRYQTGQVPDFHLLSIRQMRRLFPNSRVIAQRVTFWPETIIAIGPVGPGKQGPVVPRSSGTGSRAEGYTATASQTSRLS